MFIIIPQFGHSFISLYILGFLIGCSISGICLSGVFAGLVFSIAKIVTTLDANSNINVKRINLFIAVPPFWEHVYPIENQNNICDHFIMTGDENLVNVANCHTFFQKG